MRKYVYTEFVLEFKRGFVKASVSRAVRLRECPLKEDSVCTVHHVHDNIALIGKTDFTNPVFSRELFTYVLF